VKVTLILDPDHCTIGPDKPHLDVVGLTLCERALKRLVVTHLVLGMDVLLKRAL
jgi:hypothetical protein